MIPLELKSQRFMNNSIILWGGMVFCLSVSSCMSKGGELHRLNESRLKIDEDLNGMALIPGGSYQIGQTEDTVLFKFDNQPKIISVSSFYMDETEVTNYQYRQFINYVRDSLIRQEIGGGYVDEYSGNINWNKKLKPSNYHDELNSLYIESPIPSEKQKIDTRKLVYTYYEIDYQKAASYAHKIIYDSLGNWSYRDSTMSREDYIIKHQIPIYPDTLSWVHDFTYSFNDPLTEKYFWHPVFYNYPIVGVNWEQSRAFCHYRTYHLNEFESKHGRLVLADFRLPTEAEWEYAARGGVTDEKYNWSSPYVRNDKGDLLANYKNMPGTYMDQKNKTITSTMNVASFPANGYGLYDMSGNVAEWTSTSYFAAGYEAMHDMNSEINFRAKSTDPETWKRRVVRGGSWKDISVFLENASRSYEYQDTSKCYVGFRCVMSALPH